MHVSTCCLTLKISSAIPSSSSSCPPDIPTNTMVAMVCTSGSCSFLSVFPILWKSTKGQISQAATGRTGSSGEQEIVQILCWERSFKTWSEGRKYMYAKLKIPVLSYKHAVKCFPWLYCKGLQLCNISLEVAHSLPTATGAYRRYLETGHTGIKALRSRSAFISCNFNTACKAANRVQHDTLPFPGHEQESRLQHTEGRRECWQHQELPPSPTQVM